MARKRMKKTVKKRRGGKDGKDPRDVKKGSEGARVKVKGPTSRSGLISGRWKILVSIFIVSLLVSVAIFSVHYQQRTEDEDWTVMVYMAGDNSLSPVVDMNLQSMMEVGSNDILDIVALADRSGNQDSKLYHVKKGELEELPLSAIKVSGLNEVDTGRSSTLSSFGEYAIERHPSKNYMLVIWGHGLGWQGLATDRGGSKLTMPEFKTALERIKDVNQGNKLDIIGFDACAMATIEGFYEVSEYADILVASQKKEPDAGWPYETILKAMASGKLDTRGDISRNIVREYVSAYENGDIPSQGFSVGMTAIQTRTNNDLYVAFQRFTDSLVRLSTEDRAKVMDVRGQVESYEDPNNVDLGDFLAKIPQDIGSNQQFVLALSDLRSALDKVILREEHWNNPESEVRIEKGSGLCIYFPQASIDPDYRETALARVSSWDDFLMK